MITAAQLINKYGDPRIETARWEMRNMKMYDVPAEVEALNRAIPGRIYCNRDFEPVLHTFLLDLARTSLIHEIKTWDGCFNIRTKRGNSSLSTHAFGVAIDLNAAHNPWKHTRAQAKAKGLEPFSDQFITIARKYFDCGADWTKVPDPMHMQMKIIMP